MADLSAVASATTVESSTAVEPPTERPAAHVACHARMPWVRFTAVAAVRDVITKRGLRTIVDALSVVRRASSDETWRVNLWLANCCFASV